MFSKIKLFSRKRIISCILLLFILAGTAAQLTVSAQYIPNNRDTRPAPEAMPLDIPWDNEDEYVVLYENDNFVYSYKEMLQIIAITDKRNGYTWTTGADILTNDDVEEINEAAEEAGETPPYPPLEERLNTIYTGIANSLITFEYYDNANNLKQRSIGKDEKVDTEFKIISEDHYVLSVDHREPDVELNLHIRFTENGLNLSIPAEELEIPEDSRLSAIVLAPFLGATGGVRTYWNEEEQDYTDTIPNEMKPGYILVPDGSGALIRFRDNPATIQSYRGMVYGTDPSQYTYYRSIADNAIPLNDPVMPVYGIAHGQDQNAFVAYATSGAEYMQIEVQPEENMTFYYYAYPKFIVNTLFFQAYNKKGDGFFTLMEEPNHVDISMNYDFLAGDGSDGEPAANYVGMAQQYQEQLIEADMLRQNMRLDSDADIPLRLDFIMADAKKAVIGYADTILSTTDDVEEMLRELQEAGITEINASLMGWQKGGYTLGRADKARFNRNIGSKNDYRDLFDFAKESGIDLSLAQDYVRFTDGQYALTGNAAKHVSGFYAEQIDFGLPIPSSYKARTSKSLSWLEKQQDRLSFLDLESFTIAGLSNQLIADYANSDAIISRTDSMEAIVAAIADLSEESTLALDQPNAYLWAYTDRFLQAEVYSSQHLLQTDNVPFLQLVLNGHMEVYAPYANFSFYTESDILRMIDYNVFPSFVLTKESAHLLADTNLVSYYSTEFAFYKDLIENVYGTVNDALSKVHNAEWINREVVRPGLIRNTYDNGMSVWINYAEEEQSAGDVTVDGMSFAIVKN